MILYTCSAAELHHTFEIETWYTHYCLAIGETGVSWHVFQKNAHKTQESLISGMSDVLVKR